MLSKEKVHGYQEKLESERVRILKEIETGKKMLDFGSDVDHGEEETDETEEIGNQLAVERVLRDRINQIDMALNKIKMGTYGQCDKCGKEISEKVLAVVPESNYCENCKQNK